MAEAINTADAVEKDGGKPVIVGNPDRWQLLTKFVSSDKQLVHSTKGYEISGVGVLVVVDQKENGCIAKTSAFVPYATIVDDPVVVPGGLPGKMIVADIAECCGLDVKDEV